MKRLIITLITILSLTGIANAQADSKNIGIRVGGGLEASYQHPLTSGTRLEADLGLYFGHGSGFNAAVTHQWVWDLSALSPGFNWYAGAGAGLGVWNSDLALGGLGQIGIEYNFDIPLQLSLDWRPGIYIYTKDAHFEAESICIGIRYKF